MSRKRILKGLAVGFCLFGAGSYWLDVRRLHAAMDAYHAEGFPLYAEEVVLNHPKPEENAAEDIKRAESLIPLNSDQAIGALRQPYSNRDYYFPIDDWKACIESVREAVKKPRLDPGRDWECTYQPVLVDRKMALVGLTAHKAAALIRAGNSRDGAEMFGVSLKLVRLLAQDAPATNLSRVVDLEDEVEQLICESASNSRNSVSVSLALYDLLERLGPVELDVAQMRRERAFEAVLSAGKASLFGSSIADDPAANDMHTPPSDVFQMRTVTTVMQMVVRMKRETQGFKGDPKIVRQKMNQIEDQFEPSSWWQKVSAFIRNPIVRRHGIQVPLPIASEGRSRENEARFVVTTTFLRELANYKAGRYFQSNSLPQDPFTHQPLIREITHSGFRIYSRGMEDRTDGGSEFDTNNEIAFEYPAPRAEVRKREFVRGY